MWLGLEPLWSDLRCVVLVLCTAAYRRNNGVCGKSFTSYVGAGGVRLVGFPPKD